MQAQEHDLVRWRAVSFGSRLGCKRMGCVRRRVDEEQPLGELLAAHLALRPGGAEKAHRLREYADAGADALTIIMRQELRPVGLITLNPNFLVEPTRWVLHRTVRGLGCAVPVQ